MITALLHTLGTISFALKWQYPDLAVQGEFLFFIKLRKRKAVQ